MKNTTSPKISKKIAKYGAMSLALAGMADASGQIVFTDVEPDFTGAAVGDIFEIDFNNDGTNELILENGGSFTQLNNGDANDLTGMVITQPNSGYNYAVNFSEGTIVDDTAQGFEFLAGGSLCYADGLSNTFCGDANSTPDGFVGVSFNLDGNTHFGWIRLEGVTSNSFTITEFAYEATPNTSVMTGETLSLEDNTIEGFSSFVSDNVLTLNARTPLETVTIHSISGQEVISQKLSNTIETVDINGLSTGVYIATVAVEGKLQAFKFVK